MAYPRLNTGQLDRIARAVRAVESDGADLRGKRKDQRFIGASFYARITGANGTGKYSWRRQVFDPATGLLVDDTDAIVGTNNATEINHIIPDAGSVVLLTFAGYVSDVGQYTFSLGFRKQGFNVYVTSDGGSAGDATNPCTFTYTVKDGWGNSLATTKAVSHPRPAVGAFVAAPADSRAVAFRTGLTAGDLTLWTVAEVLDPEAC